MDSIGIVDKKTSINSVVKGASINNIHEKTSIKSVDKKISSRLKEQRETVLRFIEEHGSVSSKELLDILGLESTQVRKILRDMAADGLLTAQGNNRNRRYIIKNQK